MALIKNMMESWRDTFAVGRVFGEPVDKDGLTVIPVAMVAGGGGGGSGPQGAEEASEPNGGGFGGMARPSGVFVVRSDSVEWLPALDVTLLTIASIALAALITCTLGRALRRRR
jgi:uncharacterized spore protein YtfJ